jgi:hypothetical protein
MEVRRIFILEEHQESEAAKSLDLRHPRFHPPLNILTSLRTMISGGNSVAMTTIVGTPTHLYHPDPSARIHACPHEIPWEEQR